MLFECVISANELTAVCLGAGASANERQPPAINLNLNQILGGVNGQAISHVWPVTPFNPQNSTLIGSA